MSVKIPRCPNDPNLTTQEKLKIYRNEYYKHRYMTDSDFRKKRLAYYNRKTSDCPKCGKRIKKFDKDLCFNCDVPQIKSHLGRKRKGYWEELEAKQKEEADKQKNIKDLEEEERENYYLHEQESNNDTASDSSYE